MGGCFSVIIAVLAAFAFFVDGSRVMGAFACVNAVICLWSWLHMRYFARILARQRLFVAALQRGDVEQGSPEAERLWREIAVSVSPRDIQDVPDWITGVNMVATLVAFILLVCGGIAVLV
jgi:hypothetical protein